MTVDRPLRVLYITHRFPPNYNAGTENYTYGIASAFRDKGQDVHVLCGDDVQATTHERYQIDVVDEQYDGLRVSRLKFNYQLAPDPYGYLYIENPQIEQVVVTFVKSIQPDIIHVTSCVHLSAGVLRVGRTLGIPVVLTLTDFWFACPRTNLLKQGVDLCDGKQDGLVCLGCMFGETKTFRWLKKLPANWSRYVGQVSRLPMVGTRVGGSLNFIDAVNRRNVVLPRYLQPLDLVISPSRFLRQWFIEHQLVSPDQIIYLPHGHKTELAALGKQKTPSDTLRFGYTGHLNEHKGVHLLIQAFRQLDARSRATLHIYGQVDPASPYDMRLLELAGDDPSIVFHGRFENRDIGRVLSSIDVMVIPSLWYENAPVTIAEAFASHTPVIATNLGGMAEAVQQEVNGLLFERGSVDDLVRRMQCFLLQSNLKTKLSAGCSVIKTVSEEASELTVRYKNVLQSSHLTANSET